MKLKKYGKGGKYAMYQNGGPVKAKKMSKEELKKQYLQQVEKEVLEKQKESNRDQFVKGMSYGVTAMKNPDKQAAIVKDRIELQNKVELDKALKAASERFDKATKYDELLGRSTNPDKMYVKGGKVDPKKPTKKEAELERDAKMAKERLEELAGEKAYLAKRKEADRAYKSALKDGATEEQATKLAEKILGSIRGFKRGGMLSVKKK